MKIMIALISICILSVSLKANETNHRKLAKELCIILGYGPTMLEDGINEIKAMSHEELIERGLDNAAIAARYENLVVFMKDNFFGEDFINSLIDEYVESYTEDELAQLISFFSQPLGKKHLEEHKRIQSEQMRKFARNYQEKTAEMM